MENIVLLLGGTELAVAELLREAEQNLLTTKDELSSKKIDLKMLENDLENMKNSLNQQAAKMKLQEQAQNKIEIHLIFYFFFFLAYFLRCKHPLNLPKLLVILSH